MTLSVVNNNWTQIDFCEVITTHKRMLGWRGWLLVLWTESNQTRTELNPASVWKRKSKLSPIVGFYFCSYETLKHVHIKKNWEYKCFAVIQSYAYTDNWKKKTENKTATHFVFNKQRAIKNRAETKQHLSRKHSSHVSFSLLHTRTHSKN